MTSLALPDELNPEHIPDQLILDPEAFKVIHGLADAGVVTRTSLVLSDDLPYVKAELIAIYFGEMSRGLQWWVGDLLNDCEKRYGHEFSQIAAATGLSEGAIQRRMRVCRDVPAKRRRPGLPFSVHLLVASLGAREQEKWLKLADAERLTALELRGRMKADGQETEPPLFDDDDDDDHDDAVVDRALLVLAAKSLVANAKDAGENVVCRREDFARVKAALGEGE